MLAAAVVLVFVAGLAADQLSKSVGATELADGAAIPLLPTVSLRLAFNPGVAFGLGADLGPVVAVLILVILLALSFWICRNLVRGTARPRILVLVAVAAGGSGNMYDRITRADGTPMSGSVVDFIAVDWFAVFNVGDILAVVGILAWVATGLMMRRELPKGDSEHVR
ncbi:signal peptidase II [Pseudolysinimonas yzui]|uniref:Lipoprotein signal peptidase n=1 Tax=Pseudolysinimonas yzui TaxID=2708254 RepID=A0A8J3GPV1_9MICO|nr:signal peptidase II [Pseudolysinimonas yzui]GHF12642.1 lipoprotein signal peptidase [Pseudolysinimonas yzui]